MSEEAMTDYLTPVPVSPTNRLVAYSAAGAVYAELPARRRAFLCTKCGGRDCEPETLGQINPTCKCGYLGFAEDLDFTADDLRDFADRTHAIRAPHRQAPASVKSIELQIAEALRTKGLTLAKTATGYAVLKLGEVTAQQATPLPQVAPTPQEDARDAARWRALLSCGRIRILGTAGVTGTGVHNPNALNSYKEPYGNYVHFGGEFWSTFPDQEYYNTKENPAYARATLTEFADAVLASQKT